MIKEVASFLSGASLSLLEAEPTIVNKVKECTAQGHEQASKQQRQRSALSSLLQLLVLVVVVVLVTMHASFIRSNCNACLNH